MIIKKRNIIRILQSQFESQQMKNPLPVKIQKTLFKFFKFMLSGLPAFTLAIPLNYALVEYVSLYKPLAYGLVLLLQVSVNFFILRRFVFNTSRKDPILKQYFIFMGGIGFVRLLDFLSYSLFVEVIGIYYLYVQLANVAIFSVVKFFYSKFVLEKKAEVAN